MIYKWVQMLCRNKHSVMRMFCSVKCLFAVYEEKRDVFYTPVMNKNVILCSG